MSTAFDATLRALAMVLGPEVALHAVAETGSTNSDLLASCREGTCAQLRVAERQTAGRGRLGRSWQAREGDSLTFSLAWPLSGQPLDGLSLAVGSVLAEALDPRGSALQLKWPNDLWLAQRKLGGVLIETFSQGGAPQAVVVGVGLNLHAPAIEVPTAGLLELDARWTAPLALAAVVPPLVDLLRGWRGFDAELQAQYAARDGLHGKRLRAEGLAGIAEGVDREGQLLLRDSQGLLQRLRAGEVRLSLEAAA